MTASDGPDEPGQNRTVDRRGLMRLGGTAALVGAAAVVVGAPAAEAGSRADGTLDVRQDETGDGLYSHIENASNSGRALFARTVGTGMAVVASVANANSNATASKGTTVGSGPGVEGASRLGVGGKFAGLTAQIQLVPSSASRHPAAGSPGQLFVDRTGRLWFCRGGSDWQQLA